MADALALQKCHCSRGEKARTCTNHMKKAAAHVHYDSTVTPGLGTGDTVTDSSLRRIWRFYSDLGAWMAFYFDWAPGTGSVLNIYNVMLYYFFPLFADFPKANEMLIEGISGARRERITGTVKIGKEKVRREEYVKQTRLHLVQVNRTCSSRMQCIVRNYMNALRSIGL